MKLTKIQREVLNQKFQESFNSPELEDKFKTEYNEAYKKMAEEILQEQGFPKYVDVNKGNFGVKITPKNGTDVFVDYVEETDEIESDEEFEAVRNDAEFFSEIILKNLNETNMAFEIREDPSEYIERNPTESYLSKEMEKYFNPTEFEVVLKETDEFKEDLAEVAEEEGFDADVDLDKLDYKVEGLKVADSFDYYAELYLDEGHFDDGNTVQSFLRRDFYRLLADGRNYECTIRITTDPEEYGEE